MAENKKKTADISKLSFEEAITALTDIVAKIEKGEVPLQDSLDQYEKGMTLIMHCRTLLQQAEKRIEVISQQDDEGIDKGTAKK